MYGFTGEAIDIEDIRRRFRAMSDRDLLLTGEAAARLTAGKGNPNSPPRDTWKVQLEEATAEWRRRHPKRQ